VRLSNIFVVVVVQIFCFIFNRNGGKNCADTTSDIIKLFHTSFERYNEGLSELIWNELK
jgi:hypothetical protein